MKNTFSIKHLARTLAITTSVYVAPRDTISGVRSLAKTRRRKDWYRLSLQSFAPSRFCVNCLLFALVVAVLLRADSCNIQAADRKSFQPVAATKAADFAREVLPILSNKCFVCHGPDSNDEGQLRLDTFEAATEVRSGYQAINPKSPKQSELLARINSVEEPMPPADAEKQLTSAEREVLSRWILQGGKYAMHWAFVPPEKSPPTIDDPTIVNEVDAFLLRKMKKQGVEFAPEADRRIIARRVALTLTGLPPEPELVQRFVDDNRFDAYEKLVDELLDSPKYGEHQARYWLDAVRYGDTHGLHLDNKRGIYPFRDWVVRALNQNLPLDQFITWQLAGDLLNDPTLEQRIATGYVRLNPTTGEGGAIPEEFQMKNNFDRVETLGTVFLGMSLTCARCHTHKYDPIPQTEYYRLLAFFNSTAEPSMDRNKYEYGPIVKTPKDQTEWQRWSELVEQRGALIRIAYNRLENDAPLSGDALSKWLGSSATQRLEMLADPKSAAAQFGLTKKAAALQKKIKEVEATFTTTLVAQDLAQPRKTHVLKRGEYDLPIGEPLEPGILEVMGEFPEGAPRNRLGLAKWLTSRDHPLVARVLVNRVWQRVFGHGLVRTPEDFGLQGQQPTHPELLDWLAVELQDSGWDLKHMLKLMVTSRAFRQSSAWRDEVSDPENFLFARGPSYRLDAEVLRDVALWASGLLDPTMGGEGVKPYQPVGMWKALAHPASNTKNYVADKGQLLYRRSLYVYWKRTSPHPMMTLFDAPDRESSCVRRSRTNTSLQSLGLLNETQRIEMSRKLAERLLLEGDSDDARLSILFELLASRAPTERESAACLGLLNEMKQRFGATPADALTLVSQGEAARNEKLDPAELAAWTQVCVTVLASDVSILLY